MAHSATGAFLVSLCILAITNAASDEFVASPNIDLVFRDGRGADPWPIPDWSWAGMQETTTNPSRLKRKFNVMDFGAKHDGKTDDSRAIQAAINKAGAEGGGTVYLPAGKYLIKNQIMISESDILLTGAGKTKTTLYSPRPLRDVIKDGAANMSPVGQSRFSWAYGFVQITGRSFGRYNDTLLAKITDEKSRGWNALNVDSPEKFKPGMWVFLFMRDIASQPTSESLASALYDHKVEDSICGIECLKALRGVKVIRWAVKVKRIEGNKIFLERPLPMDIKPSWNAELHKVPEQMPKNCGIQDLGIEFALNPAEPHLKEAGFNGIAIDDAFNAYVRNVAVINSDNGVLVRYSNHVTIDGIEIYANGNRSIHENQGHIGIGLYESADVEVTNFKLKSRMTHDLSVRGTVLCVFHNGSGVDLNLDSHRAAPFATLYSSIDLGLATRVFTSGGSSSNGFPSASFSSFWNIFASNKTRSIKMPSSTFFGNCTYGVKLAFQGRFIGEPCTTYFVGTTETPDPENLFVSQVRTRLSGGFSYPPPAPAVDSEQVLSASVKPPASASVLYSFCLCLLISLAACI